MPDAKRIPFTQKELQELLHYDMQSGVFTWRYRVNAPREWNAKYAYKKAGVVTKRGYVQVCLRKYGKRRAYGAHRLAFLYMGLAVPEAIDHKNMIKSDNAWINLRAATHSENSCNRYFCNNTTGYKGIRKSKSKWRAVVSKSGIDYNLGSFETKEEAALAYAKGAKKLHGDFARSEIGDACQN